MKRECLGGNGGGGDQLLTPKKPHPRDTSSRQVLDEYNRASEWSHGNDLILLDAILSSDV